MSKMGELNYIILNLLFKMYMFKWKIKIYILKLIIILGNKNIYTTKPLENIVTEPNHVNNDNTDASLFMLQNQMHSRM